MPWLARTSQKTAASNGGRPAREDDEGGARHVRQRKDEQAGPHPVAAQQRAGDGEAREQAQGLRPAREEREGGGQGRGVGVPRPHLLEEREVHEVLREHAERGHADQGGHVPVAEQRPQAAAAARPPHPRATPARIRSPAARAPTRARHADERRRGEGEQVLDAHGQHEERHREGAGDAGHHLAGPDQREEPLGLPDVVEAGRHRPVLEVGEDRDRAIPDEQEEGERGRSRHRQPEAQGDHGAHEHPQGAGHQPREGHPRRQPRVGEARRRC